MSDDVVLDVPISPGAARNRLTAAINRPRRRSLGLFKLDNEFVGVVGPARFEIWERRQHAIHARGRIDARRGGSRVSASFVLPGRTRVLLVAFFTLYALAAFGIASRRPEALDPLASVTLLVGGAAILAALFVAHARRQRADLRRFVSGLYLDAGE